MQRYKRILNKLKNKAKKCLLGDDDTHTKVNVTLWKRYFLKTAYLCTQNKLKHWWNVYLLWLQFYVRLAQELRESSHCPRSILKEDGLLTNMETKWCSMVWWIRPVIILMVDAGKVPRHLVGGTTIMIQALPTVWLILKNYSKAWRRLSAMCSVCTWILLGPTILPMVMFMQAQQDRLPMRRARQTSRSLIPNAIRNTCHSYIWSWPRWLWNMVCT